jgi:hypothetical protein
MVTNEACVHINAIVCGGGECRVGTREEFWLLFCFRQLLLYGKYVELIGFEGGRTDGRTDTRLQRVAFRVW